MADEPLEQRVNANAPQTEKKEEKKPVGTLESVVGETIHGAKTLLNLGLAVAVPFAQAYTFPHLARDTAIMSGAQIAADATVSFRKGKKYTSGNTLESAVMGTALTTPLYYLFKTAHKISLDTPSSYLAKAGYWGGVAYPAYVGFYQTADYLIRNRTFKGLGKYLKENYWNTLKRAWKYLLPISLLNVFLAPPILNIPIAATLTYIFDTFAAPKKGEVPEEQKRDKTSYSVAAPRALGKLIGNTYKIMQDTGYALGMYKTAEKPA